MDSVTTAGQQTLLKYISATSTDVEITGIIEGRCFTHVLDSRTGALVADGTYSMQKCNYLSLASISNLY